MESLARLAMTHSQQLHETFKNKVILVTGHTGFKGAWLCEWLLGYTSHIHGIALKPSSTPNLFQELKLEERLQTSSFLDIRDKEKLADKVKSLKPDFIFHLAAQALVLPSYDNPLETFETNILGTANLLEAARGLKNKCNIVVVTTDKCYQNEDTGKDFIESDPLGGKDPYSASKAGTEIISYSFYHSFFKKDSSVKMATARAGNVIGGGDWSAHRIIVDCARAWSEKKSVVLRNPGSTRPWQHVLDCIHGYLILGAALNNQPKKLNGESFNFSPPKRQTFTVEKLVQAMQLHWSDVSYEIKQASTEQEAVSLSLDSSKAKTWLGWSTRLQFQETALWTASWYQDFYQRKPALEITQKQILDFIKLGSSAHTNSEIK